MLPGERLTAETIEYIRRALDLGGSLRGASDRKLRTVRVATEDGPAACGRARTCPGRRLPRRHPPAGVSRGVGGWVTNRSDGAVEAVFEGDPDAVRSLVRFVRDGPRSADVDRVEESEEEPEGLSAFDVR